MYVRVSSDEQARGESIGDQLQALRKWASENGYVAPIEYLDEGYSARKSYKTRPAMRRLLEDVQAGKIEIIAFVRIDRWFRSVRDYYAIQTILEKHKVEWTAITQQFDTMTAAGRLALNTHLSISEYEADQTSDRIRFTQSQKRARGEVISGSVPLGYRIENKKPVMDEATSPAVAAFWNEYTSTGHLKKAMDAAREHGQPITLNHAAWMLNHAEKYAGTVQGIETYAYITKEQAEAIRTSRKKRARSTGLTYLFNGFIYCGNCGGRLSARPAPRTNTKTGEKFKIATYFCHGYGDGVCKNKRITRQVVIEEYLLACLEPELNAFIVQAEAQAAQKKPKADPREKIRALEDKRSRLVELYIDGAVNKQAFDKRRRSIDDEIARLSVEPIPGKPIDTAKLRALIQSDWKEVYGELTEENKRSFWYQLISRIEVSEDRSISFIFKA